MSKKARSESEKANGLIKTAPCLFQNLCPNETVLIRAPKGRAVFLHDQKAMFIHHLHEGAVGIITTTKDGHEILRALILPDQFIGLAGFANMYSSSATIHMAEARALTPIVYCKVRRETVWELMEEKSVRSVVMDSICRMVYNMSSMTSNPLRHDVEARIFYLFNTLSRGIGRPIGGGWTRISGITHADIALMANTTRPTANRILNKMQDRGLIVIHRRNIDVSIAKLRSQLENV